MAQSLCCCEYIDKNGERNHILGCCCNCQELDYCFERLITFNGVPKELLMSVMSTASDRLRIPWKGGAKAIRIISIVPLLILPLLLILAAQDLRMSMLIFIYLPICLIYAHFLFMKCYPQTKFFLYWNCTSTLFIAFIFEFIGVNFLEIRLDENMVFLILTGAVLYSIYSVKVRAKMSFNTQGNFSEFDDRDCFVCNIKRPPRTYHCSTCQVCILKRDQHCAWLNCCIGQKNHFWYMVFLVSNFVHLLLSSNLILTTACHPFKLWGPILLPDDCSDVYYDPVYALCFVTAIYCLEVGIFVGAVLIQECWLISLGITGHEFRNRNTRSFCWGLTMSRPYSKGFLKNWYYFFKVVNFYHQVLKFRTERLRRYNSHWFPPL